MYISDYNDLMWDFLIKYLKADETKDSKELTNKSFSGQRVYVLKNLRVFTMVKKISSLIYIYQKELLIFT